MVLVILGVGELGKVDAGSPGNRHSQLKARGPVAIYEPGGCIDGAGRLVHTVERTYMLQEAPAEALIPAHTVKINVIGLGGINGHVRGDGFPPVDARSGGVA